MIKQYAMHSLDIGVVLGLAVQEAGPTDTYSRLGQNLGLSASTVHAAVLRLQAAGLLLPESRRPNRTALREFLIHGVRYAFPPVVGSAARGVPTAHAGPPLREHFDDADPMVWPDANGSVVGTALAPLYPGATVLPERAPRVYRLLTLVDALRVGRARERAVATAELGRELASAA